MQQLRLLGTEHTTAQRSMPTRWRCYRWPGRTFTALIESSVHDHVARCGHYPRAIRVNPQRVGMARDVLRKLNIAITCVLANGGTLGNEVELPEGD